MAPLVEDSHLHTPSEGTIHKSRRFVEAEKNLVRIKRDKLRDKNHSRQPNEESHERDGRNVSYGKQQRQDNPHPLKRSSLGNQVLLERKRKTIDHQAYKNDSQTYGSEDPKSGAAQQNWKKSQQAIPPSRKRQPLRRAFHQGAVCEQ